jgi:hypothetical protein
LDPDIVSGSVAEPILEIPTASLDEWSHFGGDARGVLWVQTRKPKPRILQHLPGREPMIGSTFSLTKVQAYSPEACVV